MATSTSTSLAVTQREPAGSRAARRLRREGQVLGVVYGGGEDPLAFQVEARELRVALQHAGAVLDLSVDGAVSVPVVVKELTRHPVNGQTVHIDLLRVRLDRPIEANVVLELIGADDSPGIKEGGVLEQITRELTIEALPNQIPDTIQHDVSGLEIGDTLTLEQINAPSGVTLVDDAEIVIATLTPPRLQTEEEPGIERETELVSEGEAAEGEKPAADEDGGSDAESSDE
jgi:large subunit ribosomal protein L25